MMSIHTVKFRPFDRVEVTDEPIFGNAGLAGIGQLMRIAAMEQVRSSRNLPNYKIKDTDILKVFCGMVAIGRVGFEHIHHVEHDEFFATALGIARMPGEASLRHRFEAMSQDRRVHEDLPECSIRMLKKLKHPVLKVEVPGFCGVRVDTDSSIFDNSQSRKEGVAIGYTGVAGYAPICSFLEGGIVVGARLCPGDRHPLHEGYEGYFARVRQRVNELAPDSPILWVEDAAFDSGKLMAARHADVNKTRDFFIIRHNLRQEPSDVLVNLAKEQGEAFRPRPGKTVYIGTTVRRHGEMEKVRLVYEVTERSSKKGQLLLVSEYTVFSVWTNLEDGVSCADVLRLYRDRGTCEQYFAEIKSELDLERLPSGKFCVNELFFQLGMFVNNMLRVMGQSLLGPELLKMKKATRRRLRTVMQNLMYMCGRVVHHAHRVILRVKGANGTAGAMCRLYRQLALA
jgi:hypothetical protein